MKLSVRFAVIALAAAPMIASGDSTPKVVLATPGIVDGAIERFTVRFSQPMVALSDPRAGSPLDVGCAVPGAGRWADQQTYVHEFARPLPGGTTCSFSLKQGLKSSDGFTVGGQRRFTVDSGGPAARAILPRGYDGQIEEDQVFLVAANLPPVPASVAANAYCAVDGLGEKIPVDVLARDLPGRILGAMGGEQWRVTSFLEQGGLPTTLPAEQTARAAALSNVVALKCRRPLPAGRDMALVWSGRIVSAAGRTAGADQRFDFTVRKPFTARFECSRVNPQAGCNPVEKAWVRFSEPVATAQARAVVMKLGDGRILKPDAPGEDGEDRGDARSSATTSEISFSKLPYSTTAQIILPPVVRDESGRPLANAERFPLDIHIDAAPPLVKFSGTFGILEAREGGVLPLTVRNIEPALQGRNLGVTGQSARISGSDGEVARWLRTVDAAGAYRSSEERRGKQSVTVNQTGTSPVLGLGEGKPLHVGLPGKGKDFEVVGIPLARPGFYVVELASPVLGQALLARRAPRYVATAALVTNMAVHFKWGRERSLAWVTSLDTGKPVANADVRVTDSCTGATLARGMTDASGGLFVGKGLPEPESYGSCAGRDEEYDGASAHPLMVSARLDDDFSFTLTSWGEGIAPSDFDLPYGYSAPNEIFHTVFDRALVRQGETLHMRHIVRMPIGSGFAVPKQMTGVLRLVHVGSDTQFDLPLKIDAGGNGENQWTAPAGAPMGDYTLQLLVDGKTIYTGQRFRVDEYRLPTMRASVTGPKEAQVRPKSVPLDLFVGYLSGGGASRLPVDVRVGWFDAPARPDGYDDYGFGGRAVTEGIRPMNGDGEDEETPLPPTQTLPMVLGQDGTVRTAVQVPGSVAGRASMQVEMDYQDANGEVLTASRQIAVYPSAVQIGVKTDGWLMKHDDLRLRLVALDTDGTPIVNQRIDVALYSRQILTARRRLIGGFYAYDNQIRTTKLSTRCVATTDAHGLAQCKLDPGVSGEVYAVATSRDAVGNVALTTQSVWLVGDDDWWFGGDNGDRMDLVPEKAAYTTGETARFQVRMPFRAATALVTVEREGVLASYVTGLSGTNPVVEVKMPGSYAPDVYVSVMVVRGRIGGFWGWLARIAHDWGLPFGSPEAAAPTATVDLAKPAYRIGIAKVKVGWEAHRLTVSVKADRERYAARDVAQLAVEVRTPQGKPAARADVSIVAVDQALLQLAPNDSWDVLSAMMGERELSVLTSTAQTQVVGKRHYGKKAVEAGGGGGGGDLSGLNRENFQPVLLWRGHVPLDANGRARVAVPLSDALTAFKLVAIATDGTQQFGMGQTDIRTAQDLSIFAGVPPLARTGDRFAAIFTLRNGSSSAMRVTANVELKPAVARGQPLTVSIPPGGAVPVAWNLSVPERLDGLRWHVSARSSDGKASDQVTVDQQIVPAVPVEVWAATLARIGASTVVPVVAPAGALPGRGAVTVHLDDSLAPPLDGVRAFMLAYPYNCLEQRLSRIVATGDVAEWSAFAGALPTYQAPDGLLRYFPSDSLEGSESLTAYVLSIVSEAGLALPATSRDRMVNALKAVIDGRLRHEDYGDVRLQRLSAFTALARAGAATPGMLGQIGLAPADMPTAELADYIVALDKVPGLANGVALRTAAGDVLHSRLVYEGTRLDLSDQDKAAWWLMSSADEGAIKALIAMLGRPGWQGEGAKMMVGVAQRQVRGRWDTTTANAWGTIAVRRFQSLYPPGAITGLTRLSLASGAASRAWPLAAPARTLKLPLPTAAAPLVMAHGGGDGPWATISVSAAVPLTKPVGAGYRLSRTVSVVQARNRGKLTRGDVIKVSLTIEATAERNWVVVSDPVPAGATIIGNQANQSQLLGAAASEGGGTTFGAVIDGKPWLVESGVAAAYVERGNDAYRAYFDWVPRGRFTVSYVLRLNNAGRFNMPPSRVEAMYSPSIFAAVPNAPMTVLPR